MAALRRPFRLPSSSWLRGIKREIEHVPAKFNPRGVRGWRRLTSGLGVKVVRLPSGPGPADRGFVDAGMDDDNPPLSNIRHDILVQLNVQLSSSCPPFAL